MSKKELTVSDAGQDEQSIDSVYDFLYHDAQRVASFIAQFDRFGHLQKVISEESATKGAKRGYSLKLAGNVPIPGAVESAEGSVTLGRDPGQSGSESLSREYDPLWTNALVLMDYLDERGLIVRDVTKAGIGQFVVVSGSLQILNAALIKPLLAQRNFVDTAVQSVIKRQLEILRAKPEHKAMDQKQKAAIEKELTKTQETGARVMLGYFPSMPHMAQCTVSGDGFSVWSTLKEAGLIGSADELALKHGHRDTGRMAPIRRP
jgi:hypothetical protein